jgi:hypothetical protein
MAKTQNEWFETLKGWVPEWFWEEQRYNVAVIQGIAKALSLLEQDTLEIQSWTFLDQARGGNLELHGSERGVARASGERDSTYRVRVRSQSLKSQCSFVDLLSLVNQFLIKGPATIPEDKDGGVFFNSGTHFNRGDIVLEPIENTFTISVDRQLHDPYSFFGREYFMNREDCMGTTESDEQVFQRILVAVNENKAFGTFYRIIERVA